MEFLNSDSPSAQPKRWLHGLLGRNGTSKDAEQDRSTSKGHDRGSNLAFHVLSSGFGSRPEEGAGFRRNVDMHCVPPEP